MGKRRRRVNSQELPPKVYLFSEDAVTAPIYLRSLFRSKSNVKLELVLGGAVPTTLFAGAKMKQATLPQANDKVWLIFDRDDHPRVDEVVNECLGIDIVLGYSNPCFELWLLYHYQDHHAPDDRQQVKAKLSDVCSDYCAKAHKLADVADLLPRLEDAVRRAKASLVSREEQGAPYGRPCSTMAAIIESLNEFS